MIPRRPCAAPSVHGFDYFPEELAAGAAGTPRRLATIGGGPVVPASHVYDQSWTKVTRTSPAGRIVCAKTTYPSTTSTDYTCTFTDVERNTVQAYNTTATNGHCPTR